MARTQEGIAARKTLRELLGKLEAAAKDAHQVWQQTGSDDVFVPSETVFLPEDDRSQLPDGPYVNIPDAFVAEWDRALDVIEADLQASGVDPAGYRAQTALYNNEQGEIDNRTKQLLALWERKAVPEKGGIGKWLLLGGVGVGALLLVSKKKRSGAASPRSADIEAIPFGALGSKSRSLRVGLMGGIAGLGALGGRFLLKDRFVGAVVGGTLGASAVAALSEERFEIDLPRLAVYGTAAGLAGSIMADRLTSEADPSNAGAFFTRAGAGAFFGGAASALTVDTFVPPEYKIRDDLKTDRPAEVEVADGMSLSPGVSLVDAADVPDSAIDLNGFIDL